MSEQELDRNQAATPFKLEKARARGEVARSADATTFVVFLVAMVFLTWQGWPAWRAIFVLDQRVLLQVASAQEAPGAAWALLDRTLRDALLVGAPFLAALVVSAVGAHLLLSGPVLSAEPLKPDWSRLSPATGLRRLFSTQSLYAALRAVLKLALLTTAGSLALVSLAPRLRGLGGVAPLGLAQALLDAIGSMGLRMSVMLGILAAVDLLYTRQAFAKRMRMSHRELKEEVKHREGDPRIRARLRELRREVLKRAGALRKTRTADVVVTNPTHVAVALRYAHGEMPAPRVVAKGAGLLAAAMRQIASRHGVPLVPNPTLARALFREVPEDRDVPPDLYAPVARIIAWIFALRDVRAARPSVRGAEVRP